jgi:hypothetical protein
MLKPSVRIGDYGGNEPLAKEGAAMIGLAGSGQPVLTLARVMTDQWKKPGLFLQ